MKWSRETGSQRLRRCYSLIETAKADNLEPYAYILGILNHIGCAVTFEKVEALLALECSSGHYAEVGADLRTLTLKRKPIYERAHSVMHRRRQTETEPKATEKELLSTLDAESAEES